MKSATCTLAAALGISLMVNAMTLHRLNRTAPDIAAPKPHSPIVERGAPTAEPPPGVDKLDFVLAEIAHLRRDVAAIKKSEGATDVTPAEDSAARPWDPELARAMADTDRWNALVGDLEKLSSARRHQMLSEDRYLRGVLDLTADFLGLQDPQRGTFIETAEGVLRDVERARRELDQALRSTPRPTREQSMAMVAQYRERQGAAEERLATLLDPGQPRQKQFSTQLGSWMRSVGASPDWRGFNGNRP